MSNIQRVQESGASGTNRNENSVGTASASGIGMHCPRRYGWSGLALTHCDFYM